jgi:ABC-type iron transport system FetAB ATPase subunit
MRIGEVMLKKKMITREELNESIEEQEKNRKISEYDEPIGNILLRKGIITEKNLNDALMDYFTYLADDREEPKYVRETAKVAMKAMQSKSGVDKLSEESKFTVIRRIGEYEEKIALLDKSIEALDKLEKKKVVTETIEKSKDEIKRISEKMKELKNDLEKFS